MSAECDKCGCNLIYGDNYPQFECQMCKAEDRIKELEEELQEACYSMCDARGFYKRANMYNKNAFASVNRFLKKHGLPTEEE